MFMSFLPFLPFTSCSLPTCQLLRITGRFHRRTRNKEPNYSLYSYLSILIILIYWSSPRMTEHGVIKVNRVLLYETSISRLYR